MKDISEERCEGIKTPEEMMNLCRELHTDIVDIMLEKYKSEIISGKKPSKSPTIYVIGGQNASGKSRLITELEKQNGNSVSIIIDDMKAYHPFRRYIDDNFIDSSEDLLHPACFEVFDRLLEDLLSNGYDITIERTLGSLQKTRAFVVEPAKHDYDIQIHVTATHEINSLLSALERFMYECDLKDDFDAKKSMLKVEPRPVALEHHDDTYNNICDVLNFAENGRFKNEGGEGIFPMVFIWDRTPDKPSLLYTTGDGSCSCAKAAMYKGRENDLRRCKSNGVFGFSERMANIQEELVNCKPGDTLSQYIDYCNKFFKEIQRRGKQYIGEKCIGNSK